MTKEMNIEDIEMVDAHESETDMATAEKAIREAFYATARGKRDRALSESRGKRLAAAYKELDALRDRLASAEEEVERLGRLLDVIGRCANDDAFSIVFDNEER